MKIQTAPLKRRVVLKSAPEKSISRLGLDLDSGLDFGDEYDVEHDDEQVDCDFRTTFNNALRSSTILFILSATRRAGEFQTSPQAASPIQDEALEPRNTRTTRKCKRPGDSSNS